MAKFFLGRLYGCLSDLDDRGVLVVIIHFFFGIAIKKFAVSFVVSIETFLLAIVGVGLFVSSLSMTQQQAILGAILVLPPATMLSGFATPIENMPGWLQMLTVANPLRWFLIIVKGLFMRGMSPVAVCQNLIPLFVISAVTLTSAAYVPKADGIITAVPVFAGRFSFLFRTERDGT